MQIYSPATPDLTSFLTGLPFLRGRSRPPVRAGRIAAHAGASGRTIHVDSRRSATSQDLDEIAFAFEKVAKQVLA